MTAPAANLLAEALRRPEALPGWPAQDWSRLVGQARRAGLLARLAHLLDMRGLLVEVAPQPLAHLRSALLLARAQQEEVRREVAELRRVLAPLAVPVVLLKGAAYALSGSAAAAGRLFGDIDILVPRGRLAEVEAALMGCGWTTTHPGAYDQHYYRQWMHELPPLRHIHRQTVLDVHHALLPRTARLRPPSEPLLAAARPVGADPGLRVLAPSDMVLHGMSHLFHNEEFSRGLRDLSDLDLLLREHGSRPGFWTELLERARMLDLGRPLYYGLRHASRLLGTPVPGDLLCASLGLAPGSAITRRLMDRLWERALSGADAAASPVSPELFMLYVRAHWLRMPPPLLLRHLAVKALQRRPGAAPA